MRSQQENGNKEGGPSGGGPGGGPGNGRNGGPPMRPNRGLFGILLVVGVLAMLFFIIPGVANPTEKVRDWNEFQNMYNNGSLEEIVLHSGKISAVRKATSESSKTKIEFPLAGGDVDFYRTQLDTLTNGGFSEASPPAWPQWVFGLLPFIILILIIWFIFRGIRSAAGGAGGMLGNFGKSKHRVMQKELVNVTFDDVAGIEEAKDEVTEIIEFLKNPKRFMKLGGRIPRGVLLVGEPGCGKTLLAKAIAGEADVPFFSISGSDFVEMFVGVGASRVRDLFKQAKESSPCIIFLDEIDAVGRRRGGGFTTGGHDEREQTLNAILVEMDGFNSSDGVIVVAATNRADVLDPALTRPGRFDRQIIVSLPDVKGRMEILSVHAKKVKMGPDVDLERVARATPMFSGADLAAIINEAAISATLLNKEFVEHSDLEEARDKIKFGRARKSRVREEEENKLTAYHEAGHAVLQAMLDDADPLHKVTIIPRGQAGGATFSLPEKDRMGYGAKWLSATLRVLCGGRIAEERAMEDVSSGASMDIAQATNIARQMVLEWGMSPRLGFIRYSGADSREMYLPDKDYSPGTAQIIDEEIKRIVDEAYADAKRMLEEHWDKVEAVADALLKYETLAADEVKLLIAGGTLNKPTVRDLLARQAKKGSGDRSPPKEQRDEGPELPPEAMPSPA